MSPVDRSSAERVTDGALVLRVLAGEQERFADLIHRHQEALYRHALGMVGSADAAADLTQDSLVRAYTRLATCSDPESFGGWVFRILRNRCLDYLKDRRRDTVPLEADAVLVDDSPGPAAAAEGAELQRLILEALDALPTPQREAFLLKHVEDRSYEEMAELLDASVSALKMRVMRARDSLQALLSSRGVWDA